jgi:hypothetical protein
MLALAGCVLAAPFLAAPAFAQGKSRPSDKDVLQAACAQDYMKLCSGVDPGGKEVEACFQRNMSQMSQGCQTAITDYQKRNPGGGRPRG